QTNYRGSCTGCFCFGDDERPLEQVHMEISFGQHSAILPEGLGNGLANNPLLKALLPGLEYLGTEVQNSINVMKFHFPNILDLPADQAATGLRLIKAACGGYY